MGVHCHVMLCAACATGQELQTASSGQGFMPGMGCSIANRATQNTAPTYILDHCCARHSFYGAAVMSQFVAAF